VPCGADPQSFDRQARRLAAARAREHAGIRDEQVSPAMTATMGIDDRLFGITAHAAGAEDVGRVEGVVRAVFLDDLLDARGPQHVAGGSRYKSEAADLHLLQMAVNARQRQACGVALYAVSKALRVDLW